MKKTILFLTMASIAAIVSCSSEDSLVTKSPADNIQNVSAETYSNAYSNLRVGDRSVLFTYTTPSEAITKTKTASIEIALDARDDIKAVTGATQLVSIINVSQGKGKLQSYHFLNAQNNPLLSYVLNPNTNQYQIQQVPGTGIGSVGACPQGYTQLASCNNFSSDSEFSSCLGGAQANFANLTLTGTGSCMNLQISVGTEFTTMCGRNCAN